MKLALALIAATAATTASAQDFGFTGRTFSVDLGLGASIGPEFPGSDEADAGAWLIWRNAGFGEPGSPDRDGFAISPSFNTVGERNSADYDDLAGMKDIDRAYELGLGVSYGAGPFRAFAALRRGFDGHEGTVGEVGARYRTDLSDRVSLWSSVGLGYGNSEYNNTYFGVTPDEARAGRPAYTPGSGLNTAAIAFEMRYAVTEKVSLLGEIEYAKLIGNSANSPVVQDEYQPTLRLGVVRTFSFDF